MGNPAKTNKGAGERSGVCVSGVAPLPLGEEEPRRTCLVDGMSVPRSRKQRLADGRPGSG